MPRLHEGVMRGVLAVNWVAGLVVGNKAGKMYREPYNTYADIQAPQFRHSGLKTVAQSLLQSKLKYYCYKIPTSPQVRETLCLYQ